MSWRINQVNKRYTKPEEERAVMERGSPPNHYHYYCYSYWVPVINHAHRGREEGVKSPIYSKNRKHRYIPILSYCMFVFFCS